MSFMSRTQLIVALGMVALALYVLDLVRRRRLSEEYSLLWVIATTAIAVLGFSTPVLLWMTGLLGIKGGAVSTVFAFGIGFTMSMLLYLSVKLSRIAQQNQVLTQEMALLRYELERATGAERA